MENYKNYQIETNRVFSYTNPEAQVVIVGITPGVSQDKDRMSQRDYEKLSQEERRALKMKNAFAGRMRPNLNKMLDCIKVNEVLGIASCEDLWCDANFDKVETTSLLKNPVCEPDGKMFNDVDAILESDQLYNELYDGFIADFNKLKKVKLVVALSESIAALLLELQLRAEIPVVPVATITHPSGANQGRVNMYLGTKEASNAVEGIWADMRDKVKAMIQDYVIDNKTYTTDILESWLAGWADVRKKAKEERKASKTEKSSDTGAKKYRHVIELQGCCMLNIRLHKLSDYGIDFITDLDDDIKTKMKDGGGSEVAWVQLDSNRIFLDGKEYSGCLLKVDFDEELDIEDNTEVQMTSDLGCYCEDGVLSDDFDMSTMERSTWEVESEKVSDEPTCLYDAYMSTKDVERDGMKYEIDWNDFWDRPIFGDKVSWEELNECAIQIDVRPNFSVGAVFESTIKDPDELIKHLALDRYHIGRFVKSVDEQEMDWDASVDLIVQGDFWPNNTWGGCYTFWTDVDSCEIEED